MECVCGCGTEIPKRLVPTNLVAGMLMFELAEWDRFRFLMRGADNDEFEENLIHGFIEDGALCYQQSLFVLHGEAFTSSPRNTNKWLKFSRKSRKKLAKKFPGVIQGDKEVRPPEEDVGRINALQPELSYTGVSSEPTNAAEGVGEDIEALEREYGSGD